MTKLPVFHRNSAGIALVLLLLALSTMLRTHSSSAIAAAPPPNVGSGDWPAFHRGGPLDGVAPPISAPPMKLRWSFRAIDDVPAGTQPATQQSLGPARFEGAPVIANGFVYVADTGGSLRAIDLKTGKQKWSYRADDGFETTPLVIGNKVLLGDLSGMFHCVNAADGHRIWIFDSSSIIHSSANAQGNRVVFGDDGADIFCLDADTGKKLWDMKAGDRVNGAPAIVNGAALVSGCDSELRGIALQDGKEQFTADLGGVCPGSAAVLGNRIVVGTDGGRVLCFSADKHEQLWLFENIGEHAMVYSSPAVADGVVVVGARDRNVYGLDLNTGKKLWNFPTRGEVDSSPAISAGRVYIGSKDKKLYVLELKTGKKLWEFTASRAITGSPAIGEGAVVFGDTAGVLYCLE